MATTDDELKAIREANDALRARRDDATASAGKDEADKAREAEKERLLQEQAGLKAQAEWAEAAAAGKVVVDPKPAAKAAGTPAAPARDTTAAAAKAAGEEK